VPSAEALVLELTEHADVDDYPTLHNALACLRSGGIRVAVDDTGSGFASLRHILNLRPDIIKLDLALVRDINQDPARRALAQGMLTFASEIGAEIVAEGIETTAELAVLQDIGIPHGQGYLLGRPAALPLLERFAVVSQSPVSSSHF
jgi:EAL domain-containing protein (putative c-di-GMP-specific phosphodiesterase class I)